MVTAFVIGLVLLVALGLTPVAVLHLARHGEEMLASTRLVLIRAHLWRRPPVQPSSPPLEELAAALRRLYPDAHHPPAGMRMPKQRGVLMAYDERLALTARVLEVSTTLLELPLDSFDREAERLRVEHALTDAGLVWQVRHRPPDLAA